MHSNMHAIVTISGGGKPYKRLPTQIVVAAFHNDTKAEKAAELLIDAAFIGLLRFRNLAVVRKDEYGAVKIQETGDMTDGLAATVGMFLGGLALLILGPAGVVAGGAAGAIVGRTGQILLNEEAKKVSDKSLDKNRLVELGDVLKPGSSAVVVVVEEAIIDKRKTKNIKMKLTQHGVLAALAAKIRMSLDRGKDVAYAVSVDKDRISAVRMVSDEHATDIKCMFATSEGVTVGRGAKVSPEDIVYEVAETTAEGTYYEAGIVDADEL